MQEHGLEEKQSKESRGDTRSCIQWNLFQKGGYSRGRCTVSEPSSENIFLMKNYCWLNIHLMHQKSQQVANYSRRIKFNRLELTKDD